MLPNHERETKEEGRLGSVVVEGKIPGGTINNIYCISDASLAVALDSAASH